MNPFDFLRPARTAAAGWGVQVLLFAPALSSLPAAAMYPTFTRASLEADFDQLRGIVATQHPRLYVDRAGLDAAWEPQRALLHDGMDELEFLRVVAPLVRRLNCGHTSIRLSSASETAADATRRLLPLVVVFRGGQLYVGKAAPGIAVPLGAEVVSVNGRSAAELIAALYDVIPSDGRNLTLKQQAISRSFSSLFDRYIECADRYTVEYLDPLTGTAASAVLAGVAPRVLDALADPPPNPDNGIGSYAFAADHAYLAIRSFNFYDAAGHTRFNAFVDEFFTAAASRGSPVLILDLRGNGGGDPYCGAYLFSHLLRTAQPYFAATTPFYPELKVAIAPAPDAFGGRMFFLIDGGCFSTTGHFCSLLRYHGLGEFVGQETGGSFTCTAANQSATLGRTGLRFSYSTQAFATAVSGLTPGRGIMPDIEVDSTSEDYLRGYDTVRAAAIARFRPPAPPVLEWQPSSVTVAAGDTVVLHVQAAGDGLSYGWSKDGTVVAGATRAMLVLANCTAALAGEYRAEVTNAAGTVRTVPAAITVSAAAASRLVNVSVRTVTRPGDQALTVGFVAQAVTGPAQVLLRALGPRLAALDVPEVLADPRLELIRIGRTEVEAANEDWGGDPEVRRVGAEVGAFPLTDAASRDAALMAAVQPGAWTMRVPAAEGTSGTALAEGYAVGAQTVFRNVSARAQVEPGVPLIAGFVISGATARTVLVRGLGPFLQQYLGTGTMANPAVQLFRHVNGAPACSLCGNDDWAGDLQTAAIARAVGAQPIGDPHSRDAALVVTLDLGVYSVHVNDAAGGSGIALVEVYLLP